MVAAEWEFEEELGKKVPSNNYIEHSPVKSKSNKTVIAFAIEVYFDTSQITSNTCFIEWYLRSGRKIEVPDVEKAGWLDEETAGKKIIGYQLPLIDILK